MLRYENFCNNGVSVDLKNGYSVLAVMLWNNESKNYTVSFYLKGDTYDTLELIESKENFVIESTVKTVKYDVTKIINDLLFSGFFKEYTDRYEYMMKCFDMGNELYESERMK